MAELRREGLGFAEVGARRGFSERTARRFVGKVEPRLTLPQGRTWSSPTRFSATTVCDVRAM